MEENDDWTEDSNFEDRLTGNTDTLLHPADVRSRSNVYAFAPGENQSPLGLYEAFSAEYLLPFIVVKSALTTQKDLHL